MIIRSRTAQMADHIRRLPRNPFLVGLRRDEAQQRVDAWSDESSGLLRTPPSLHEREGLLELFKEREDPRLQDVWRQHREMALMMSSMQDYIDYDQYFTDQQNLQNEFGFTDSDLVERFGDILDDVEDDVENPPYPSLHGTAAHQKFMEMANEFNDKWQDEVFEKPGDGGVQT